MQETTSFPPAWWPDVEAEMLRRVPTLLQSWETEALPKIQEMNQRLRDFDYAGASMDGLLAFIDRARKEREDSWDIHMQIVIPIMGTASRFGEVYEQMLGTPANNEPYWLLQGFDNKSTESGIALWAMRKRALADPAASKIISETPIERVADELRAHAPAFWRAFEAFLQDYGWRSDAFELADPAWTEDPSIPLAQLRDYLKAPDGADPAIKAEQCRVEREQLVEETLERLDGHEGKPIFQMMLGVAQQYLPVQENHNFYIDQMNTVLQRRPFLELGRRLADAGTISDRDDVFYLEYSELASAATQPAARDWKALVAERRVYRERWSRVVPPREIGTRLPEELANNPISTAFFGKTPEASKDPKIINGIGASAGTVTATACVVRTLAEAHKLQEGDVLVCEMTMPAWTPLFATVTAVVADSGGVLSHCAIVAREYRIPCVVGTQVGTQVLKDGQRITVDGAQGIVRIEG
jgi:pyruvate,water dikinase